MSFRLMHRKVDAPKLRADWLPNDKAWAYVRDMLDRRFDVDVDALPEEWIPLAIKGTLEWVIVCGWWIFRNTGIYESDEPYKWVFDYDGYEFDPDQLQVFKEDVDRNMFEERWDSPGLTRKETAEAAQYLFQDVFSVYWQERERTQEAADAMVPPPVFIDLAMYCVFMWLLDDHGRDWICEQDEVFSCVRDFNVAYLEMWDNTLLDPNIMVCTKRPINSCKYCDKELWCVGGTLVNKSWQFVCNHCLVEMALESHHHLDAKDGRLQRPSCPHWNGIDGEAGTCMATCPHSGMSPEKFWERAEAIGSERLDTWRQHVRSLEPGERYRQLSGAVRHYRPELEDKG